LKILDTNRFYLSGAPEYLHLASVEDGFKEYVCFYKRIGHMIYIEEITGGNLKIIEEDDKWRDIYLFLLERKALNEPFLPHYVSSKSFSI
jgi:hypothetical protein